ncbi:hypothetical protein BDA99DRAFT_591985 [Phascolomyces articulosus]|uniref:F-box domain-containing protein n=1 Tax=Phascolomyces articulosus TaxID=60185 RepID=A0AAD5P887_9FUNG|nr:hypothetical protein BDA99DRAFT_591985 [Phascolomyces articulosus]
MAKKRHSKTQRRTKRAQHHFQQNQKVLNTTTTTTNDNDTLSLTCHRHLTEEEQQQQQRKAHSISTLQQDNGSTMFDRLFLQYYPPQESQSKNNTVKQRHHQVEQYYPYASPINSSSSHLSSSMLDYARRKNRKQGKKRIDPMTCSDNIIASRIFSFMTKKKDCLIAMKVSKLWMERVPLYTTHVWKKIKLGGSKKQQVDGNALLENPLIHRCLGPHVETIILSHFYQDHQQQNLFKMLQILENRQCTQLTELRFKLCNVKDQQTFLDCLTPLLSKVTKLTFDEYIGSVFPIQSMVNLCPNLEQIDFTLIPPEKRQKLKQKEKKQHQQQQQRQKIRSLLPSTKYHDEETTKTWTSANPHKNFKSHATVFNLTNLKLGLYSMDMGKQHGSKGIPFHCSGLDLSRIISHSPQLKTVYLSRTGDNLDSVVIDAITQLSYLRELGLYYELDGKQQETDHDQQQQCIHYVKYGKSQQLQFVGNKRFQQQGALYTLLSKHAKLDLSSPLRLVSLNVADDIILNFISRMYLQEIELTDGFSMVSSDGIVQFTESIYCRCSLASLTLGRFDLRSGAILDQFSRLSTLRIVDFSDCYVEKKIIC